MGKDQIEIERKFIIKMPDVQSLRGLAGFTESHITQIYLPSEPGLTHRIRKREYLGKTEYTETEKLRIDAMSVVEREKDISAEEYNRLSLNIDRETSPITKTRYTFAQGELTVEIDVYPNWHSTCIMEIELPSREEQICIPGIISIVREVTGIRAYSNAAMAKSFPKETV